MLYIIEPASVPTTTTTTTHGKSGSKNKNKRVKTDWNALISSAAEAAVVAVKDTLLQPVTSATTTATTTVSSAVSSVVSKLGRRKAQEITTAGSGEKEEGEEER